MTVMRDKWKSRNKYSLQFNNLQVKASGVLFYHFVGKELFILICEKKVKVRKPKDTLEEKNTDEYKIVWEDFGGKVDHKDKTIYDTSVRETMEESNNIFNEQYIRDQIQLVPLDDFIWNANCCYGTFVIPLVNKIDPSLLGEKEFHDNLDRTCKWISYKDFLQHRRDRIHIRLKTKKLLDVLDKLVPV